MEEAATRAAPEASEAMEAGWVAYGERVEEMLEAEEERELVACW